MIKDLTNIIYINNLLIKFYLFFFVLYYKKHYIFFFFFFQAEDGIRDGRATGVQTCALPISRRARARLGWPPASRCARWTCWGTGRVSIAASSAVVPIRSARPPWMPSRAVCCADAAGSEPTPCRFRGGPSAS